MTEEQFDSLLSDPDLPWAHLSGDDSHRAVDAPALLEFARARFIGR